MNKIKKILVLCAVIMLSVCNTFAEGLLSSKYSVDELKKLLPESNTIGIPKIDDRDSWKEADQKILKSNYDRALTMMDYEWKPIPATVTMMYVRTGNRTVYQSISFEKRRNLFTFLMAEIYENKGRFMDQILDGVWSICEESYWGVSAHLPQWHGGAGLPDINDPYVELFSAETACVLSLVDYIVGDKLDKISRHVRPRIAYEIEKRIFTPVMTWDHPWMHLNDKSGKRPNNWNPWICSNWLFSTLLMEKDPERKAKMVSRILLVLDQFLTPYPEDGGCDEGPGYWNAAPASLYDNLELLNLATNNAFSYVFESEKVKNMGRYIYRVQISDKYFLNFADAGPKVVPNGPLVWRFGRDIKDSDMMSMGAYYNKQNSSQSSYQRFRVFFELFTSKEYAQTEASLPLPKNVWLPDLEVMIARDKEASSDGFFMAYKGGHNAESHNHNDIGNYVVYYNGLPLIIDVGSGVYTARSFSSERYEIWSNCSDYHNCPTINGYTQKPGRDFKAEYLNHDIRKNKTSLKLDISKAYPADAGINYWNRTVSLNRGKNVKIEDEYSLKQFVEVKNSMMTCWPVEILSDGEVVIKYTSDEGKVVPFVVKYDSKVWEASVEQIPLEQPEDEGVKRNWGNGNIRRICFTAKNMNEIGKYEFLISKK